MLVLADVPLTASSFYTIRIGTGAILAIIAFIATNYLSVKKDLIPLISIMFLIIGILVPQKLLSSAVKKRKANYRDALPDIMDLLIVSVEAGLGFDAALLRLYEKDKSPLMQELIQAENDIQHGMSKKESYAKMIDKCQVKEITAFLNAMVQAEQMGISIKSVLKAQSEALREERRHRAEEAALKAPVKMLIPMVIFIFPVIFIILLGPALMNILEVLG